MSCLWWISFGFVLLVVEFGVYMIWYFSCSVLQCECDANCSSPLRCTQIKINKKKKKKINPVLQLSGIQIPMHAPSTIHHRYARARHALVRHVHIHREGESQRKNYRCTAVSEVRGEVEGVVAVAVAWTCCACGLR